MFHFYRAVVHALQNQPLLKKVAPPATKAIYFSHDEVNRDYVKSLSWRYQVECEARSELNPQEVPADCRVIICDKDRVILGTVDDLTSSLEKVLELGVRVILHTYLPEQPSLQALAGKPGVTIVRRLRDALRMLQPASQRAPRHLPMIQAPFQSRRKAS